MVGNSIGLQGDSSLSPAEQRWFPAWIRRRVEATKTTSRPLAVTQEGVIDFLRMLRDGGRSILGMQLFGPPLL